MTDREHVTVDYIVNNTICHDTYDGAVVKAAMLNHTGVIQVRTSSGLVAVQYNTPLRIIVYKPHDSSDAVYPHRIDIEVIYNMQDVTHTNRFRCGWAGGTLNDGNAGYLLFRNGQDEHGQHVSKAMYRHADRVLWEYDPPTDVSSACDCTCRR